MLAEVETIVSEGRWGRMPKEDDRPLSSCEGVGF